MVTGNRPTPTPVCSPRRNRLSRSRAKGQDTRSAAPANARHILLCPVGASYPTGRTLRSALQYGQEGWPEIHTSRHCRARRSGNSGKRTRKAVAGCVCFPRIVERRKRCVKLILMRRYAYCNSHERGQEAGHEGVKFHRAGCMWWLSLSNQNLP